MMTRAAEFRFTCVPTTPSPPVALGDFARSLSASRRAPLGQLARRERRRRRGKSPGPALNSALCRRVNHSEWARRADAVEAGVVECRRPRAVKRTIRTRFMRRSGCQSVGLPLGKGRVLDSDRFDFRPFLNVDRGASGWRRRAPRRDQASRVAGVTPAALSALHLSLVRQGR